MRHLQYGSVDILRLLEDGTRANVLTPHGFNEHEERNRSNKRQNATYSLLTVCSDILRHPLE